MMHITQLPTPQPEVPDYHRGEAKAGVNYDAGALLDSMRPRVELILGRVESLSGCGPGSRSQSLRAKQAIAAIDDMRMAKVRAKNIDRLTFMNWIRWKTVLQNFLNVHAVVSLMEGQ
jgi:hypothetical protein